MPNADELKAVISLVEPLLISQPNVEAVGFGFRSKFGCRTKEPVLKVLVREKLPASALSEENFIPRAFDTELGTVETDVEEIDPITSPPAIDLSIASFVPEGVSIDSLRDKARPVFGGLSCANSLFDTGTLCIVAQDKIYPGLLYGVSNNHVFARLNKALIGEPILQPATGDGGTGADCIGKLARFVPINLDLVSRNLVDAAAVILTDNARVGFAAWLGQISKVQSADNISPGQFVTKVGRTSGLTRGEIVLVHATCKLYYTLTGLGNVTAIWRDQIITTGMASYGDSGSPLLGAGNELIGMLAGGSQSHTVFNYAENVQDALGLDFV